LLDVARLQVVPLRASPNVHSRSLAPAIHRSSVTDAGVPRADLHDEEVVRGADAATGTDSP